LDLLTQLTLGAAVGEATAGRKAGNKAVLMGAIGGLIPDLDTFGRFFMSEVDYMGVHRGFSHSLTFAIIFPYIFAFLTKKLLKKTDISIHRLALLYFLAFLTHILLDSFTSYGTQLFQPFSNYAVAWNSIFIIDPLYTLPLLIGVVAAMFFARNSGKRLYINWIGIGISTLYLFSTLFTQAAAKDVFVENLNEQGRKFEEIVVLPTPLNTIMWYAIARDGDKYYMGVHSLMDDSDDVEYVEINSNSELITSFKNETAIEKLMWFTKGFYQAFENDGKLYISALKFGSMDLLTNRKSAGNYVFIYEIIKDNEGRPVSFTQKFDSGTLSNFNFGDFLKEILGKK
jgi:inner membrane protein